MLKAKGLKDAVICESWKYKYIPGSERKVNTRLHKQRYLYGEN